jgi:CRP-like cAMP-binding protein
MISMTVVALPMRLRVAIEEDASFPSITSLTALSTVTLSSGLRKSDHRYNMEHIRSYFKKYTEFTEGDWLIFSSKLKRQNFPKNALLLEKGQIENYLSFVEKGAVRYYIPGESNDITLEFTFENDFIGAYDSFLTRKPSAYNVVTITPTVLWRLTYDDAQTIYRETENGNLIGRLASEALFLEKSKRELSLLTDSAEQRYLNLFKEQPAIIKNIPLRHIASYIGITPQALSRIRKRIS